MAESRFDPSPESARALDAADELAPFREQFVTPQQHGQPLIHLCGHSLGLMPKGAERAVMLELERWGARAVAGHFPDDEAGDGAHPGWIDYHERFAAPLSELCGAASAEVVAMNTLTVNLHLMLVSFFRPTAERRKILIEREAFSSDRYAVASHLRLHGLDVERDLIEIERGPDAAGLDVEAYEALLRREGERIALVLLPGVQYLSGERLDIARYTRAAHAAGCRIGFDLAHAIGNVPLELHASGPDFAVWCGYKYLNGGPGAVGGAFVHGRWHDEADLLRFDGWWGHERARRFLMEHDFKPMPGAAAWQLSNPPIFSLAPLAASLELFGAAGMARLRSKSERLTAYLEQCLEHRLGARTEFLTPRAHERRGCQLSLRFDPPPQDFPARMAQLRAQGVVADSRAPNVLRLAPVPLYNSFVQCEQAARAVARAFETE